MASPSLIRRPVPITLAALLLAIASTLALPIASAFLIPLDRVGHGEVARDGDHLQPWVFRLKHPTGSRLVWFEKGRIWNQPGVGPTGASSVAVSGWSFATGTRSDPRYVRVPPASLPLPTRFQQMIDTPNLVWALAEDQRGWPCPALACVIAAPLNPAAPSIFTFDGGSPLPTGDPAFRESIASVRVLPLTPLWSGLATDVAAHAAIWWSALMIGSIAIGSGRRSIRRARGLCPQCSYDLKHAFGDGCSECGWNRAEA